MMFNLPPQQYHADPSLPAAAPHGCQGCMYPANDQHQCMYNQMHASSCHACSPMGLCHALGSPGIAPTVGAFVPQQQFPNNGSQNPSGAAPGRRSPVDVTATAPELALPPSDTGPWQPNPLWRPPPFQPTDYSTKTLEPPLPPTAREEQQLSEARRKALQCASLISQWGDAKRCAPRSFIEDGSTRLDMRGDDPSFEALFKGGSTKAVGKLAVLLTYIAKYKTEQCRAPRMQRGCEFHSKCLFVHKRAEVRRDPLSFYTRNRTCYGIMPCPHVAAGLPCQGETCRFAHSQLEIDVHPLVLLRELEADGTCRVAQVHNITFLEDEEDDRLVRIKVNGKATKQRTNVPRPIYEAQGSNVLHVNQVALYHQTDERLRAKMEERMLALVPLAQDDYSLASPLASTSCSALLPPMPRTPVKESKARSPLQEPGTPCSVMDLTDTSKARSFSKRNLMASFDQVAPDHTISELRPSATDFVPGACIHDVVSPGGLPDLFAPDPDGLPFGLLEECEAQDLPSHKGWHQAQKELELRLLERSDAISAHVDSDSTDMGEGEGEGPEISILELQPFHQQQLLEMFGDLEMV